MSHEPTPAGGEVEHDVPPDLLDLYVELDLAGTTPADFADFVADLDPDGTP